jgi:DUF4097 and DUF4098 domain-containing protein YvlB
VKSTWPPQFPKLAKDEFNHLTNRHLKKDTDMKKILIITTILLQSFFGFGQEDIETITIPLSKPGQRATIALGQVNGDITVSSYGGAEVIIEASFGGMNKRGNHRHNDNYCESCDDHDVSVDVDNDDDRKKSPPPGMKRIESNPVELSASEENNIVEIDTESWKRKINLNIKAPANTDLELSTVHGVIKIDGINGAHDISSVNGGIEAYNVSGSMVANTVNGSIVISFQSINKNPMSFVTLNGDVDVTFPTSAKLTTKMKSDRGEIYSDFDMSIEKGMQQIRKDKGEYEVSINSWVFGKINGGGSEHTFKNMNGDIIVRKGK